MDNTLRVAVVGARGAVGEEILATLAARRMRIEKVAPFASKASAGEYVSFGEEELPVEMLGKQSFEGIDLAFFCAGSEVAKEYAPLALQSGAVVIDCSEAFRLDDRCPLIVPEVNAAALESHCGIIASPESTAVELALVLHPLHSKARVKRIVATVLQSASGAGKGGIEELEKQVRDLMNMREITQSVFPRQIAFNLFPRTSAFLENEYTRDEVALALETQKIFDDEEIALSATSVQVPVFFSHALSLNVSFADPLSARDARALLAATDGVHVVDNPHEDFYPTAIDCGQEDDVFVGRIRNDSTCDNTLNLWVACDNLRKGSALNCVQICSELLERNLLRTPDKVPF